jgi:hypothetical protein
MSEASRMLMLSIALVVFGSATAVRGVAVGDALLIAVGLGVLAVVMTIEVFGMWPRSPRSQELFLGVATRFDRRRRLAAVVLWLLAAERAIRCVVAVSGHDWWALLFYAVTGLATAGMLTGAHEALGRSDGATARH